jgi:Ni,Fe-hydrogenase maturation factor
MRLQSADHLEPGMVEDLHAFDRIILVDATTIRLEQGWKRETVKPASNFLPYLMHHMKPSMLLGLMKSIYGRCPPTWLFTVQGFDFGLGEGLTLRAREKAEEVVSMILRFVERMEGASESPWKRINGPPQQGGGTI